MLVQAGRQAGFDVKLLTLVPPNFAQWRWGTMAGVCAWIVPNLPVFDVVWIIALFSRAKSGRLLKDVDCSLRSEAWKQRCLVISDAITVLDEVRTWGVGSSCHEEQRMRTTKRRKQKGDERGLL